MSVSLTFLSLCMAIVFLGPLLHPLTERSKNFTSFMDGFVLTAVVALVFFHILPYTIEHKGWLALVMAFTGMLLPNLFEKWGSQVAKASHRLALILAIVGLTLHMFMDGIILIQPEFVHQNSHSHEAILPLAVLIHRIPMALMVWWVLRNHTSKKTSLIVLFLMGMATALGYFFGVHVLHGSEHASFGLFEALVAGTLLHVIFHYHQPKTKTNKAWKWASGAGCLTAIASGIIINSYLPLFSHSQAWIDISKNFISLALESAPALLIAFLGGGLIQVFLPKASVRWMRKGSSATQSLKGMIFGLPLPVCSCGVVPLYRSLVKRGTPVAAATAFFIATPELGLDAILISLPLLGKEMMIFRIIAAAFVAFTAGWFLGKTFKSQNQQSDEEKDPFQGLDFFTKLKESLKSGLGEVADHTIPWILVGLLIAALIKPVLDTHSFSGIPSQWQVPLFAILGMPVYVCAAGATPLVAVLLASFASPGAALAFLLTGPATNITTFGILSDLHGKKMALVFAICVAGLAMLCGFIVNAFFPVIHVPDVFSTHHHETPLYQTLSLYGLGGILLSMILRKGPRHLINQIISFEPKDDSVYPKEPEAKGCCH